jgi:hypothetical protein
VKKALLVLAASAVLLAVAPSVAKADGWVCYYCGPAWLSSGEGHPSGYDGCNNYWTGNALSKSDTALGRIVFIDTSGGWVFARETYEVNMVYFIDPVNWVKKLYGQNTSSVGYSANMQGYVWYVYTGCT